MNPDDPRLTAYALGELEPAERAEIEQLLREEPGVAAEIEAGRLFAETLRFRLKRERAEPLLAAQRAEVLACTVRDLPSRAVAVPRRIPGWLTLAAGVAVGIGVGLLFPVLNSLKVRPTATVAKAPGLRDGSDVRVSLLGESTPIVEDLVVLNEWPSDGMPPMVSNSTGVLWALARMPFSESDAGFHFETMLPVIEFSTPLAVQNTAPVSSTSRRNNSRQSTGAKTLREARYASAPTPLPAPEWDTRAVEREDLPENQAR